jgi:hypothetical protein
MALRESAMRKHSAVLCLGVATICALFAEASAAHAQDKVIKIGGLFAMSGPGSYFGVQDKQGIELAIEQLNKSGVNGYRFEVQYEDSACSPLPATQAAKRLLEQFKPHVVLAHALGGDREHRSARNAAFGKISPDSAGAPQGEHGPAPCAAGSGRVLQRSVRLSYSRRAR